MDISQVVPIAGACVAAGLAGAGFVAARRVRSRGARLGVRVVLAILCGLAGLVAVALLFFDLRYTREMPQIPSPDGRRVAVVTYTVGTGEGFDEAEVAIRAPWSPMAHRVYAGPAHYDPNLHPYEPEVEWLDATHVLIRFHTYVGSEAASDAQGCAGSADGVTVECEQIKVHAVR